jgi:hypothetical protein
VSNKEGTFFDSREKFSVNFWQKYFSAVGGRTVWICTVRMILCSRTDLARKSRQFLAWFSRQFLDFRWLFLGHTEQSVQWIVGTKNEVQKRQDNGMVLA